MKTYGSPKRKKKGPISKAKKILVENSVEPIDTEKAARRYMLSIPPSIEKTFQRRQRSIPHPYEHFDGIIMGSKDRTLYNESKGSSQNLTPRLVKTDMGTLLLTQKNQIVGYHHDKRAVFQNKRHSHNVLMQNDMQQTAQLMIQGNSGDFSRKELFPYPIYELADSIETFRSPHQKIDIDVSSPLKPPMRAADSYDTFDPDDIDR